MESNIDVIIVVRIVILLFNQEIFKHGQKTKRFILALFVKKKQSSYNDYGDHTKHLMLASVSSYGTVIHGNF